MNEPRTFDVSSVAHGGAGVARPDAGAPDGRTWLIDGALPGERVTALAHKEAKRHVLGHVIDVLEPAPERTEPPCPLASRCGGCQWQHVDPAAQARLKTDIVEGQLRRLDLRVTRTVPAPAALGYRRRARLHYRRDGEELRLGFFAPRSRDLVDVTRCAVLEPALDAALQRLRALVDVLPDEGEAVGLTDGEKVVLGLPGVRPTDAMQARCRALLDRSLIGITLRGGRQRATVGRGWVSIDGSPGHAAVRLGPFAFAQAQQAQNLALVDHVVQQAQPGSLKILELHAGSGNFTRQLARESEAVWAIEADREGISGLEALGAKSPRPIHARKGNVEKVVKQLASQGREFDVIVLDPPRGGVGRETSAELVRLQPERVVYVSCDPATLARDIEVMVQAGYRVTDLTVFDMMPMTPEVETVVTLARGGKARRREASRR